MGLAWRISLGCAKPLCGASWLPLWSWSPTSRSGGGTAGRKYGGFGMTCPRDLKSQVPTANPALSRAHYPKAMQFESVSLSEQNLELLSLPHHKRVRSLQKNARLSKQTLTPREPRDSIRKQETTHHGLTSQILATTWDKLAKLRLSLPKKEITPGSRVS